jgi:hypothetical protein
MRRLMLGVQEFALLPSIRATVTEEIGFISLSDRWEVQYLEAALLQNGFNLQERPTLKVIGLFARASKWPRKAAAAVMPWEPRMLVGTRMLRSSEILLDAIQTSR